MLESDKGKHVLPVGKLPPKSERIKVGAENTVVFRGAFGGEERRMSCRSAPPSPSKTDLFN